MNVYENGAADKRQSDEPALAQEHSLFRKRYRQLSADEVALHDAIKDKADELAALIARINAVPNVPANPPLRGTPEAVLANIANNPGANVTLALRHLEDSVYRAVKALTA